VTEAEDPVPASPPATRPRAPGCRFPAPMEGGITLVLLQLFTLEGRPKTDVHKTPVLGWSVLRRGKRSSWRGEQEPQGCERIPDLLPRRGLAAGSGRSPSGGDPAPLPRGVPVRRSPVPQPALRQRGRLLGGGAVRHSCCAAIRAARLSEAAQANGGFGRDAAQPGSGLPRLAGEAKPEPLQGTST